MDMRIYCLKCKIKTDSSDITKTRTKNNRNLIRGTCSKCGNKKSVFVSAQHATVQGTGFSLNNLINNLPVELHQFAEERRTCPRRFVQRSTKIFVLWSRYKILTENKRRLQRY